MCKVIIIGGATAIGKTSIITELEKLCNIKRYKIKWALKEAALRENISAKNFGDNYPSLISLAKDILIKEIIPKEKLLIIDAHYAIQLNFNYSLSKKQAYVENVKEPYISGIEPFILEELASKVTSLAFIFIQAPIKDILTRRINRIEKLLPYRSLIPLSIITEQNAEKKHFFKAISLVNNHCKKENLPKPKTLVLNNTNNTFKAQLNLLNEFIISL